MNTLKLKFFTILLAAAFLTGCSTLPKSELYKIKSALNYEARKTANNYVSYGKYNKFLTEGQKEVNGLRWDNKKTGYVVDCDDYAQVLSILMYERGIDTGVLWLESKNKKKYDNHLVAGTIIEENGELILLITEPQNGTTTRMSRDWWSKFKYTGMRITYTYVSRMDLGKTSEAGMAPTAIFNAIRKYSDDTFGTNDANRFIGVNEVAKLVEQMREENYDTMDHLELLKKLISYAEELLLEKDILTKNTKSIDSLRRVFTN